MRSATESLQAWLDAGGSQIGEILLSRCPAGGWELRHRADQTSTELTHHRGAEAARDLAHYTDDGGFRPLKTAPNLRHGWRLTVDDFSELRRALDYFYPAMIGIGVSHACGALSAVPFRTTLARQTGMYRITQKITDDQAQEMIGTFCRSNGGCLKHILWPLAPGTPVTSLPAEKLSPAVEPGAWPLLCQEACNLLVAKAREVVKKAERNS